MASTPPGPWAPPPGLTPLNLERVKEVKSYSAPASAAVSPSSPGNISPIDVVAFSPLGNLSMRPGSNGSSERNGDGYTLAQYPGDTDKEVCTTSRSVEPIELPTPRSTLFPSFSLPQLASRTSPSFFGHKLLNKEKEKEKEEKIKYKKEVPLAVNNKSELIYYPLEYRGFLETYVKQSEFSEKLRRILGINSFADATSIGLFHPHIMNLDIKRKVLISSTGIIRMANEKKVGTHKDLLNSLCRYDRSMSYWLSTDESARDCYTEYMKKIFFEEDAAEDISGCFKAIPQYVELDEKIAEIIDENQYKEIHRSLMDSLKEYEYAFSIERYLESLKKNIDINNKEIEQCESNSLYAGKLKCIISEMENTIKNVEGDLKKQNMQLIPGFTKEFKLRFSVFDAFRAYRQREACETLRNMDAFPNMLPLWSEDLLCPEGLLKISLYFFATLCKRRLRFYDMIPGEMLDNIYINEKFLSDFEKIKTAARFKEFIQRHKTFYDQGQAEIVLYKTLEYIQENAGIKLEYINEDAKIKIDYSVIIDAALEAGNEQFPLCKRGSFCNYDVDFFRAAIHVVYEEILKIRAYHSKEPSLSESVKRSGPAPRM